VRCLTSFLSPALQVLLLAWIVWYSSASRAEEFIAPVSRVTEGDTIVLRSYVGREYTVRMVGIDAPETDQPYGRTAGEYLARSIVGRTVTVEWDKRDLYDRIVGKVLLDGEDMNLRQVRLGLAWHDKDHADEQTKKDRYLYAEAESHARDRQTGLWSDPDPVTPWDWRQGSHNGKE
jgi:endonuclease YncB( thermonuclease family)